MQIDVQSKSKSLLGVSDLTLVATIKSGLIPALDFAQLRNPGAAAAENPECLAHFVAGGGTDAADRRRGRPNPGTSLLPTCDYRRGLSQGGFSFQSHSTAGGSLTCAAYGAIWGHCWT